MIAKFSFIDLTSATGCNVLQPPTGRGYVRSFGISTDTRTIKYDNVYLPLVGSNFDGHDFINDALKKGVRGFFIDKDHNYKDYLHGDHFVLEVGNTLLALLSLASYYRKQLKTTVIAITGSSGKTTTKEMAYSVLSEAFKVQKSQMNYNNEIGMSKTLLDVDANTEIVILEMGMRALGEIDLLAKHALPDISVITNVGTSHIGRLGSIENIATAKTEILKYLDPQKGKALLFGDDKLLLETSKRIYSGQSIYFGQQKDYQILECTENKVSFMYKEEAYELTVPGNHNVINATVVIELGKLLGMNYELIRRGLKLYRPLFGRWNEYCIFEDTKIINDAYNANPDSTKASIETIFKIYADKKIWLVLGDMLELGYYEAEMHKSIGRWLIDKPVETIISVGKLAKLITNELDPSRIKICNYDNAELAAEYILETQPHNTVILLKASRGIGLEKILDKLALKNGGCSH